MNKCFLLFSLLFISSSHAQGINTVGITSAVNSDYIVTESGLVRRTDEWSLGAHYFFSDDPFTGVEGIHTLSLKPLWVKENDSIGLDLPIHQMSFSGMPYRWALGDARIVASTRVFESVDKSEGFALIPEVTFPTGNTSRLVSNGGWGAGMKAAYENDFKIFKLGLNAGYRMFSKGQLKDINYRRQAPFSGAVYIPLAGVFSLNAEYFQTITFNKLKSEEPSGETYFGGRVSFFGFEAFLGGDTSKRIHLGAKIAL